jgi:hypothetical protein
MLLLMPSVARALELEPNEYVAAPPGTTALFQYFVFGDDNSYHPAGGTTYSHGTHLTETVGITRATQFFDLGPIEGLAEILQPWGGLSSARIDGTTYQSSAGLGDTILAAALWPYKNAASRSYVGVAAYITVPDGAYNASHTINLGGNRMVYDPELAVHQGFDAAWSIDLTGDLIVYGNNNDAGAGAATLSQHPTLQVQAFINYAWSDALVTSVGYEGEAFGKQYLNGMASGGKTEFEEIRLVGSYAVTPSLQLLGEINHQFNNVGGFKQDLGITLRALTTF